MTSSDDWYGFGGFPAAALIQATDGNFYGTTSWDGAGSLGTVFKLIASGTLTVLHAFIDATDGAQSYAPLVQATDGNFYGTPPEAAPSAWARPSTHG